MTSRGARRLAAISIAAITPFLLTGVASAGDGPTHQGDPQDWGPPLAELCAAGPAAAEAAGYYVIEGDNLGNVIDGTANPDAIFAYGGNDKVRSGPGADLVCLSYGHDRGRGNGGNDAVFGDQHNDDVRGDAGRDYLNGGSQNDKCYGGTGDDAGNECEVGISIP